MFFHHRVRAGGAAVGVGLEGSVAQLGAHRTVIHGADLGPGLRTDGRFSDSQAVLTALAAITGDSRISTCGAAVGVGFKGVVAQLGANRAVIPGAGLGPGFRASGQFFTIWNSAGESEGW